MKDWKRTGQLVGYWRRVGEQAVVEKMGRTLYSDYLPMNYSGDVVGAALGKKKKKSKKDNVPDYGYWKMHLPMLNRTVDFHRQLLQDFLQDSAAGADAHHGPRGRDYNCVGDLEKRASRPHRSKHGADGGSKSAGKRKFGRRRKKNFS